MSSPRQLSNRMYAALMFFVVSLLSGLLVSGLFVPFAALAGGTARSAAAMLENLPAELETPPQSEGSSIYLADGSLLANIYEQNRTYMPLDQIAPVMRQAQVAIEDHRFYEHGALDFYGTMRALFKTGGEAGGSSITQQYVKLVQVETAHARGDMEGVSKAQERKISRKIQELRYAIAMERKFSKDQILERYLNIALYGDGAYGVEAAAHHFFNTSAKDLTLPQAAMLAGLVKNPSAYNPALHPKAALERRDTVLFRLHDLGMITEAEYDKAQAEKFDPAGVQPKRNGCVGSQFPQLCSYAMAELGRNPNIPGSNAEERIATIGRAAYSITLTIDPAIQKMAQETINKTIAATDPVIATTAFVQPGTGKIRVMAQSRSAIGNEPGQTWWNYNADYGQGGAEGYQAGSTFKIFTVAAALAKGIPPTKTYDSPAKMEFGGKVFESCDGPFKANPYPVPNDGNWSGKPDMYVAAQNSVNTYFLQLQQATGICDVAKMADAAGVHAADGQPLTSKSNYVSFSLGTVEVSPLSIANAYATFAARGMRCDTSVIEAIKTKDGQPVPGIDPRCTQAIPQEIADGVNAVMKTVVDKGSGIATRTPGYDLAGKTGTTDDAQSLWYAGYSPDLAGSSMISLDKLRDDFWSKHNKVVEGVTLPSGTYLSGHGAPDCTNFFTPIMRRLLASTPATKFTEAKDDILKGKMVDVPKSTLNPEADEEALRKAGFVPTRVEVPSSYPYGYYLGLSPTGKQPFGSSIELMFSAGQPVVRQPQVPVQPTRAAATQAPRPTIQAPAPTQPAATQPAATKPAATQPAATQPAATQPAATQPAATQPAKKP